MKRLVPVVVMVVALAGCLVGPNYTRPSAAIPQSFRAPEPLPAPQAASFANLKWFEIFKDDKLQGLIRNGLAQNYDLRDAVARVEAARANLGITRSAQYPNFGASGSVEINRLSRDNGEPHRCQLNSCLPRIAISERLRLTCCRSKSTCGEGCAAQPRRRAPAF